MVIWYELKLSITGISSKILEVMKQSFLKTQYIDDQGSFKLSKIRIDTSKFNILLHLPMFEGFNTNRRSSIFVAGSSFVGIAVDANSKLTLEDFANITTINFRAATYYHIIGILNFYECKNKLHNSNQIVELLAFLTYTYNTPIYLFNYCKCGRISCNEKNKREFLRMWRSVLTRYHIEKNNFNEIDKTTEVWKGTYLLRNFDFRGSMLVSQSPSFEFYFLMNIHRENQESLENTFSNLSDELFQLILKAERKYALLRLIDDHQISVELYNFYRYLIDLQKLMK